MKTFIKVFSIVIGLLMSSSISYGSDNYFNKHNDLTMVRQCVVKISMETTWIKVVDIDDSGNPLNFGWPLFDGVLSKGESIPVKCTHGHVTIHYQTKSSGRTYVMTDQYCNNNTITVP